MSPQPDRLILVYDGNSGMRAMLLDVIKKAVGREDCPLCEITYAPTGKRSAWKACEARLGLPVEELHRDELPAAWNLAPKELPCILGRVGSELPFVLIGREEILACKASVDVLEQTIRAALDEAKPEDGVASTE